MLILDLDRAGPDFLAQLAQDVPLYGVWGMKCRNLIHQYGASTELSALKRFGNLFADIKISEVGGSVETLIMLYASLPHPPQFLSISGEVSERSLKIALALRGSMEIVYIPMLSDQGNEEIFDTYGVRPSEFLWHRLAKARRAGITHITCPAWLLPTLNPRWGFRVIATGTRSERSAQHEHKNSRTIAFAFEHGAAFAVTGREVILSINPMQTLQKLVAGCRGFVKTA